MRPLLRAQAIAPTLVAAVALGVFWRTAYPTITWWDSSNYSLAATTLGLTSSPGSLLLTLLGWVTTRLPIPLAQAHILNLLAGALGALASALMVVVAVRIHRVISTPVAGSNAALVTGAGIGAMAFAFSATVWEYAIKFTPYVLTVVFTAAILLTLVRWWEDADRPDSWRWIVLLAFLFGLDFSVHRTNALLMPGALAWMLIRRPRTLAEPRSWSGAVAGMAVGLSFQMLVMPVSSITTSPLNMWQPDTWTRFWDYVALAQSGGSFQLELWPRKSPFWSNQVADVLRVFVANFAHRTSSMGIAGWLPALAGISGMVIMWRRSPRFALAFSILWVTQISATVLYFNIPANYFRSLDRHYLPTLATFAVAVALGAGTAVQTVAAMWKRRPVLALAGAAIVLFLPFVQAIGNWKANDASHRYFTRDFAVNALETLPPGAFYFTVRDNDTFPVMYVQAVERVRPDVRIINLSLANTDWYIDQMRARDPSFPVEGTSDERRAANASIWRDSSLVVRLTSTEDTGTRSTMPHLDSLVFRPVPSVGNQPLPADDVLLDIVREAAFTTPVTVAMTAGSSGLSWLRPYARVDGLHWRVVPARNPLPDPSVLRANLLDRNEYRGYRDSAVVLDDVTRTMGFLYLGAFQTLMEAENANGNVTGCQAIRARVLALLPPSRLATATAAYPRFDSICAS